MILAENISKSFNGIKAVNDISFEVAEGHTLVLLGTSGCGKTTTLKMLNRLVEATAGNVFINGKSIFETNPETLRRHIGYVSQSNGLFPHFTVAENIAVVPGLLHWDSTQIKNKTNELLHQLQMAPEIFASKYPDELSGGQKQRVALARALASNPPVLLMDEPFGALDPITRLGIRKEFLELPELKTKTVVLVTHDVQEAFELGDRICLMDKGQIVQNGTPGELIFHPENDFVKSFLGHQRLQLELGSIKIKTIWDELPDSTVSSQSGHLTTGMSLWEAMEILAANNSEKSQVIDRHNGTQKDITLALLHSAFMNFKHKN